MKTIPLLLMGCGGVGRKLLHHIVSCRSIHAKQGVKLRVVGVCDSKSLIVASDVFAMELDDKILSELCRIKLEGSPLHLLSSPGKYEVFTSLDSRRKIIDVATLLSKSTGLAFVDCSASSETISLLKTVVDLGCCIVLANKKPLTSSMEDYEKLFLHPRQVRHESTGVSVSVKSLRGKLYSIFDLMSDEFLVGAGLPVISSLTRLLSSGDTVYRIIGSLSGTLGYVMSEVEDGKLLSTVVRTAKTLGYTEPDPRDDLSGMDVARKALILARLLGRKISLDGVKIESLYPKEMQSDVMSADEFLGSGILLLDKGIQERVSEASLKGNVLRYTCLIDGSRCEVGLQELPKNSPLGRLRGSDNLLEVYSRCYSEQPLVIQGAGAGNDTTAAGVLADILDLQDLFP